MCRNIHRARRVLSAREVYTESIGSDFTVRIASVAVYTNDDKQFLAAVYIRLPTRTTCLLFRSNRPYTLSTVRIFHMSSVLAGNCDIFARFELDRYDSLCTYISVLCCNEISEACSKK